MTYLIRISDKQPAFIWKHDRNTGNTCFLQSFPKSYTKGGQAIILFLIQNYHKPTVNFGNFNKYLTYTSLYPNLFFQYFLQKKCATTYCFSCKPLYSFNLYHALFSRSTEVLFEWWHRFYHHAMNGSCVCGSLTGKLTKCMQLCKHIWKYTLVSIYSGEYII